MRKNNSLFSKIFMLATLCGAMSIPSGGCGDKDTEKDNTSGALDRTYTVNRGDLTLGVTVSGTVNARKKYLLRLEANMSTKLLWIIDENTHVKEGDVIARFDSEDLKNKINDLSVEVDNLEKELDVMLQDQTIQESTGAESMRTAHDRLDQALDALRKYRRYELRSSRDDLDTKIQDAEVALSKAKTDYNDYLTQLSSSSSSDANEQAKQEQQLSSLQTAITNAEKTLESAESARKVFLRYDNPTKMKSLNNEVEQAKLNLEKVQVQVNSQRVQKQREIDNMRTRIRRQKETLAQQQSYLPMMEMTAPVDGIVLYGNPDERWNRNEIKLGMDIYRGMVLMTIPDMRNLIVDFDLPEMYRSAVSVGNNVIITPDSLQGVKFSGKLDHVATMPVNEVFWDPDSPKVYKSKVEMDSQDKQLVNGMSVQLDIVTGVIPNTLFVPVEAVFENEDKFFVYLKSFSGPEERIVTIGRSNDAFVEITSGLEEGDVVYLYRPFQSKEGEK